jgi:RHS repeat-associated protein
MDGPYSQGYDYDVWGNVTHKFGWGGEVQGGTAGQTSDIYYTYTNNRRNGFSYDAAGNLTNDLGQTFTYDVTGQQTNASYSGYSLVQSYDGDGLRVKKNDNGAQTYYLRSSVLGGQVVAEINWFSVAWGWNRGYVYLGSQLLALQQAGVYWMHEDPVTKSKRVTNSSGAIVSTIELDPWGADTPRSNNAAFQPKKYTSYDRDGNGSDEAMFRRYNRWHSRFDQPDPYEGSYDLGDPQSFNRYAYVQGDPVNFVDPSGLDGPGGVTVTDPATGLPFYIPGFNVGVTIGIGGNGTWGGGGNDGFASPLSVNPWADALPKGLWRPEPEPQKTDVVRRLARDFPCNRNAIEEMQRVKSDFSQFANFTGDFGPLGAPTFNATVTFASGPVTQGRNIGISSTVSNNAVFDRLRYSTTTNTSVNVREVWDRGFTFDTAPNHPFYPGTIQFGTMNMGSGKIKFSINIYAHFNGLANEGAFYGLGGGILESRIWNNLINNIKKDCSQ